MEAGAGDASGLDNPRDGELMVTRVCSVGKFSRIDHTGPSDPFTVAGGNGPRMGWAFDRAGSFHLPKSASITTVSCDMGSSGLAESTRIRSARFRTPTPLLAGCGSDSGYPGQRGPAGQGMHYGHVP